MPMLLKRDSVRMLEASVDSLYLALVGLGLPQKTKNREKSSHYSSEIGLIGVSAELAMSACLVQAYGAKALEKESGKFKTGGHILSDFRKMITSAVPRISFITKGIADPASHLKALQEATHKFTTLISARAGGLHAGKGSARDICVILGRDVVGFLQLLSQSSRIRTYLDEIPEPPEVVKDREIILEDLARRIHNTSDPIERAGLISAVYLVLPEVPAERPEWIDAFERVSVAPREQDISYLLDVLENSKAATLFRVNKAASGEGHTLPVVVKPDNPEALPIAPHYLKREFTTIKDQFYAEAALANGRLSQKSLHIVSEDLVLDIFVLGLIKTGILNTDTISAQQLWPFIISSFEGSKTPGPYWFFVRKADQLGQLNKYLERATALGNKALGTRISEAFKGLKILADKKGTHTAFNDLHDEAEEAENKRQMLSSLVTKRDGKDRELTIEGKAIIGQVADGDVSAGEFLLALVEDRIGDLELKVKRYWAFKVSETAIDEDDLPGLLAVLRSPELSTAHTIVRKAIRRIDFLSYGPSVISIKNVISHTEGSTS